MEISFSVPEQNTIINHGYGQASYGIVRSLQSLGHSVAYRSPVPPVEFNFSEPMYWMWSQRDNYRIGMAAWESTELKRDWKVTLRGYDELWATSPWVARVYEDHGYSVSQIYQHGVDPVVWTRQERQPTGPIRLLHIGEPAPRKGGQLTYDVFSETFGDTRDVTLTIKAQNQHKIDLGVQPDNVTLITDDLSQSDLVKLVHDHDVLVYPSYGEGFGLIPLQAMVTGMPTICTAAWAPYDHLLADGLRVESSLQTSPWKNLPGKVHHPDPVDLAGAMLEAVEYFDHYSKLCYLIAADVQEEYDWDKLTKDAFKDAVKKFEK